MLGLCFGGVSPHFPSSYKRPALSDADTEQASRAPSLKDRKKKDKKQGYQTLTLAVSYFHAN